MARENPALPEPSGIVRDGPDKQPTRTRKKLSGKLRDEVSHRIMQAARKVPPNSEARLVETKFAELWPTEYEEWRTVTRSEVARLKEISRVVDGDISRKSSSKGRRAPPQVVSSSEILLKKREARYALLSAEVFEPLEVILHGMTRSWPRLGGTRNLDFSVEFSTENLRHRTLFMEGILHLRQRTSLDGLVELLEQLERSVVDWNTKARTAVQ